MSALPIVTFLAASTDYTGSLYGYAKENEISPAQATADALEAAEAGEVTANVVSRGDKQVLTVSLSKRAVNRIRRAERKEQAQAVTEAISATLEAQRPQKIGTIVTAVQEAIPGTSRGQVLDALRAGRDSENPVFFSYNSTNSNFYMEWSNEAPGEDGFAIFPEPQPEPEAVEASSEGDEATSEDTIGTDEADADSGATESTDEG